jgi:hypothetical protein
VTATDDLVDGNDVLGLANEVATRNGSVSGWWRVRLQQRAQRETIDQSTMTGEKENAGAVEWKNKALRGFNPISSRLHQVNWRRSSA